MSGYADVIAGRIVIALAFLPCLHHATDHVWWWSGEHIVASEILPILLQRLALSGPISAKYAAVPVLWSARCSAARSQIQIGEPNGSFGISSDGLASQCDVAATVSGLSCGTMCGKGSSKSWRRTDDDRHARLGDQKES